MSDSQDEYSMCLSRGLSYLSIRNRSEKEMSDYLAKKNFHEEAREKAIDYMRSRLLIDDERFAVEYFERLRSKNYGRAKIMLELKGKGINSEIIELAVSKSSLSDYENCLAVADKKLAVLKGDARKKLPLFLRSRGFEWDVIKRVLRDIEENRQNG